MESCKSQSPEKKIDNELNDEKQSKVGTLEIATQSMESYRPESPIDKKYLNDIKLH